MEKVRPSDRNVAVTVFPNLENGRTNLSADPIQIILTSTDIFARQNPQDFRGEIDPYTGTTIDTTERPIKNPFLTLEITWKSNTPAPIPTSSAESVSPIDVAHSE